MDVNNTIPTHIAIIMDGNRRWAKEHGLPVFAGHQKVTDDILEPLIEYASDIGVRYLTFWAWSTENWNRTPKEVAGIMRLFRKVINDTWDRLHKKGVKILVIGDISKFEPDIQQSLKAVIKKTQNNSKITAVFALNYGGRDEIIRAVNKYVYSSRELLSANREGSKDSSRLRSSNIEITAESFSTYLDTAGIPDPELVIRTGGEQRLSGFLLWQSQYSEFYFPTWYMPDFTPEKLDEAIKEYSSRQRRFGK
jgi:undecaprenyl diphosphate synthase